MKKRLISLLLAFSMMLTFLPAGAVSAFAEETADDTTKGTLLTDGQPITTCGTYRLSGNYTKAIKITTSDLVTINIADGDKVTFSPSSYPMTMLQVEEDGNLIVNNHGSYEGATFLSFAGKTAEISGGTYKITRQYNSDMGIVAFDFDKGEDVTIENAKIQVGDYCNGVRAYDLNTLHIVNSEIKQMGSYQQGYAAIAHYKSSNVTLDGVIIETGDCPAIFGKGKSLIINSGKYTSAMNTVVVGDETEKTVINGGEFEVKVGSSSCNVVSNSGPMEIHGGKFTAGSSGGKVLTCYGSIVIDDEKSTPEFYGKSGRLDAIQFRGSYSGNPVMQFKAGIIHISGGVQRAAIAIGTDSTYDPDRGTAIIDSNRVIIEGGTYGIRVRGHVTAVLNDITVNRVGRSVIYLEKDQKIKISDTYTGNATILCADPKDGRQLTKATETETAYQKKLDLTSANEDYLVGYKTKDGKEYRCLSKKVGVTINGLKGDIKAEDPAEFTVTLTHENSTGTGILTFGDKNGEIEYKDEHGAYQRMPDGGLPIHLASDKNDYVFHITPKNAGDQKLTAAVERDDVELGTADKDYTVAGRVHTTVTIEGLEDAVIKEGESKDFTVKVDPKDDAKLGEAVIDFGNKNSEIEYKDENGEYKLMPEGGLKINLENGEVEHEFRITPKETGKQTLTAAVKQDKEKLAKDEKDFVVSEMPILTLKDGVITSVTVPGKDGADPEDITEIVKKNANEDGSFNVPEGATVSVAFDKDAFADSGLKFGHWDITGLDDPNAYQDKESFAFVMPAKAVTLKAMTQDASIEDDEPDIVGPIVIGTTVVVGGAVLGYQAYSLGAEFAGKLMALPYFPSNRSALAMMLWEDAGKPMPESELLYPDVGQEERDMDLQHAARWAMENDLVPNLNDEGTAPEEMKFYPDNAVSKIDVLKAWQKAQELKQNA